MRSLITTLYHVHPRLPVAYKAHLEGFACSVARASDAVEALILGICLHEFPREFVCELKSLHKSIALKLVERPLFAGADYLGEACECLMIAVKTLFPTRNVNHILLFCVLSYYFYAKRARLHTIKARSATISTDHATPESSFFIIVILIKRLIIRHYTRSYNSPYQGRHNSRKTFRRNSHAQRVVPG